MKTDIAVKGFIVNDGKLLIVKRSDDDNQSPGVWELPGGRLEVGENPSAGLIRETKEETDIDIEVLQILNVHHFTRHDGNPLTLLVFLCHSNNDKIKLSFEHTKYEWVSIKDAKNKISEFFYKDIDLYHNLGFDDYFC